MTEPRFKPGDVVFCDGLAWGCGTVVEVSGLYLMRVDFGRNGIHPLSITDHWRLATEEDKRQSASTVSEPEPSYPAEEATLGSQGAEVAGWEGSVKSFEAGFYCDDEYTHDLFSRECLHGVLNGFASQSMAVPDDLKERVEAADKRFLELTYEVEHDVWGGSRSYDRKVFWYYYRMI